jgi:transposase
VVERARIVLLAAEGLENKQIAKRMEITPEKTARWRNRFLGGGIAALEKDAPRPGRTRTITDRRVKKVVEMTLHQKPVNATHWSTRTMAAAIGISAASVRRIWRTHGLKPHLVRTFKLSRDPAFPQKLEDIVGLYLNRPEHALVLCADEKSQIQALDRTQPGLPMKKGRCRTMTHDYKRNGATTLFAALDVLQGQVISMCDDRRRHQEWLKFLRTIDYVVPADKQIHMIVDNYATRFASAAGAASTATNRAASASRKRFFQAKNWPLFSSRTRQNAATLWPLCFCSAANPRHFVHTSVLRCLMLQECGTLPHKTRCAPHSPHVLNR